MIFLRLTSSVYKTILPIIGFLVACSGIKVGDASVASTVDICSVVWYLPVSVMRGALAVVSCLVDVPTRSESAICGTEGVTLPGRLPC